MKVVKFLANYFSNLPEKFEYVQIDWKHANREEALKNFGKIIFEIARIFRGAISI